MPKAKFDIQGMTCSSCSAHVDKAVNQLKGVKNVNVNLLSNNMTLEYEEKIVSTDDIIHAVVASGYGATLVSKQSSHQQESLHDDEIQTIKKRLLLSFIFLVALVFVSMHHMILEALHLPIPEWIKNVFHGNENALIFAFTQLLLLLPIIYCNRNYFVTGIKRLLQLSPNMDSLIAMRKWHQYNLWNICNIQNWLWFESWRL